MKQYKDEIVHFSGGIHDYIGSLETSGKEAGGGQWFRIHEPCLTFTQDNPALKTRKNIIALMSGAPGARNYHNYVDIYIPQDSIIEIRVLDKNGDMFRIYRQEVERKPPNMIIVPQMGVASGPN